MTIVYPSWFKGGRWDVERLLNDLFTFTANKAAAELSGVRVEPFVTKDSDREPYLAAGNGFLLVHRRGGHINKSTVQWTDESIVELCGLTTSRDESLNLMDYVTTVLSEFDVGGTVKRSTAHRSGLLTTFMKVPGEVVGPQLIPELFRDDRYVPATWEIHADVPRGLPNYRESLGLDD